MLWASHLSTHRALPHALNEVARAARESLDGKPPDIAFLFVAGQTPAVASDAGRIVRRLLGGGSLVGCSAGGVIGSGREVEGVPAVSLVVGSLPGAAIRTFHLDPDHYPDDDAPPSAWHAFVGTPAAPEPSFVILPDPFSSEAPRLIAGLDFAYPGCVKVGGLASGGAADGMNVMWRDDDLYGSGVVGASFGGSVRVDTAVAQGCRPVGSPTRITKAARNWLVEVDGKPALDMVEREIAALSHEDRELARTSLCLGIDMDPFRDTPPAAGDFLIRNLLGVDPARRAVAVGEILAPGRTVQLHLRDAAASAGDLRAVLQRAKDARGSAYGALLFSCLGRGLGFYGEPDHDSRGFKSVLGDVPLGGFFCSGEIGPVGESTYLHGYTSSFALFRPT